jgi:hypothetical protein
MAFETCTQVHGCITTSASISCGVHVSSVAKLETDTRVHAGGNFDWVRPAVADVVHKPLESLRAEGWGRAGQISTRPAPRPRVASTLKIRELEIFRFARNSPGFPYFMAVLPVDGPRLAI